MAFCLMDTLKFTKSLPSGLEELHILFKCLHASPNSHDTYVRILETKLEGAKDFHELCTA